MKRTVTINVPTNTDYPDWIRNEPELKRLWRESLSWRVEIARATTRQLQEHLRRQARLLTD